MTRSQVLQICIEKLRLFTPTPQESSLSQRLHLNEFCSNGVVLQPIHHLLATVALILHPRIPPRAPTQRDDARIQELTLVFNQIIEQLIHTETEEFQLDKGSSFNPGESEGRTNLCKRHLLYSMYLTVVYVRAIGIQRLQEKNAANDGIRTLMAGQIATVLGNVMVSAHG